MILLRNINQSPDRRDLIMTCKCFCAGDDNFKAEETKSTEPASAAVRA